MGQSRGWLRASLACLLLLGVPALCSAGLRGAGPTIDGRAVAACVLREEESRVFSCRARRLAPGAMLVWYLDGQREEANCSAAGTTSTLTLTAQRHNRELNCSLTDPASGESYNTSVLLDVQCTEGLCLAGPVRKWLMSSWSRAYLMACVCLDKPEILRADVHYQEVEGAGLLLVFSVLVQANPPARVTWLDQDGHAMANTSEFLLLGATHYKGLANHSLCVRLGSASGNFSVSATNSVGVTTIPLLPPGLLDARVELPLLAVAVGAALALCTVVGLGSCAAYLACRQAEPQPGKGQVEGSSSSQHSLYAGRLPRQTQSLPPDLCLKDLIQEPRTVPRDMGAGAGGEERVLPCLENPLVFGKLGFVQLPVSGRIYKVPSTSSDEIWL